MNITNADYFTFNVDNSMFLVGQTNTGKSYLQAKLIGGLVKAHTPETLQFVLLDMTGYDYWDLREKHKDFIQTDISFKSEDALQALEELAKLSDTRKGKSITKPQIFVCIEECDMAVLDQSRFDNAVSKINTNARQANMKLVFSTSRPSTDVISKSLLRSFDLIAAGHLASKRDYKYLGVPMARHQEPYTFIIVEKPKE
jgi:DNA segregation ATPase FtsK/SpoIIIE-like protein